jgi:hypothetical protein
MFFVVSWIWRINVIFLRLFFLRELLNVRGIVTHCYCIYCTEIQILKNRSTWYLFYRLSALSLDPKVGQKAVFRIRIHLIGMDLDSEYGCGSGSTDLIESGSITDPDPKH